MLSLTPAAFLQNCPTFFLSLEKLKRMTKSEALAAAAAVLQPAAPPLRHSPGQVPTGTTQLQPHSRAGQSPLSSCSKSQWHSTGKTPAPGHKLFNQGPYPADPRRSDPKTHLSNTGQGATALQGMCFTSAHLHFPACALNSALPNPHPSFVPCPATDPVSKAVEETMRMPSCCHQQETS